jgi:putative NADH-flavin reductase
MNIAIIGSTRGIGLALVSAALSDGHTVTALARNPDLMPLRDERLRVVAGDAEDPVAVSKVVEGQDVVCSCLGTRKLFQAISLFSRAAENLSKALKPQQLLIAVTGIGTGDSRGHGSALYDHFFLPVILGRMYADKEREEAIIKKSVGRWIIVRPGFLNDGPRTGRYRALTNLQGIQGGRISRADVADFVLSQAKDPQFIGQTPLVIY